MNTPTPQRMNNIKRTFNTKELIYLSIYKTCIFLIVPFYKIGNWAVDKLNKSYYNLK